MPPTKCLVVSAVNFTEGGPLRILQDALISALEIFSEWKIVAVLHSANVLPSSLLGRIEVIELPRSKRSWILRLWYEWIYFKRVSANLQPDLWFSLHDITPRIFSRRQVVYCHNPTPFYSLKVRDFFFEPRFAVFCTFYKYIYGIMIQRNYAVVVQQGWIRDYFIKEYKCKNVIVAHPQITNNNKPKQNANTNTIIQENKYIFLYPALPRVFKNIETICQAIIDMPEVLRERVELRLTISGSENSYSRYIYKKYGKSKKIKFIGYQNSEDMFKEYQFCNAILFPSLLETWGLPLSEAMSMSKDILVADLPYAHYNLGAYKKATYLDPNNYSLWMKAMVNLLQGIQIHSGGSYIEEKSPFASDWNSLYRLLAVNL